MLCKKPYALLHKCHGNFDNVAFENDFVAFCVMPLTVHVQLTPICGWRIVIISLKNALISNTR